MRKVTRQDGQLSWEWRLSGVQPYAVMDIRVFVADHPCCLRWGQATCIHKSIVQQSACVTSFFVRLCSLPRLRLGRSEDTFGRDEFCLVSGTFCKLRFGVRHPDLLWCQTPIEQLWCGQIWRGDWREERGRRGNHAESAEKMRVVLTGFTGLRANAVRRQFRWSP